MTEEIKEEIKEKEDVKAEEKAGSEKTAEQPNAPDNKTKKEKKDKYKEQVLKLEEELKVQRNEYLKVFAEMENTKRRLKEESIKDRKYASQNVVSELINPIDMLMNIVNSPAPSKEIENYLIGFKMIANQLADILKKEGLAPIEALNKEFDPKIMQAMGTEENDELAENTVVKVLQNGYMYKDRVLRPAMVNVSKKAVVNENNEEKEEE